MTEGETRRDLVPVDLHIETTLIGFTKECVKLKSTLLGFY